MDIEDLTTKLFKLKYTRKLYDGTPWEENVIDKEAQNLVRETIFKWYNENHGKNIGELKAKVYTYEKIIANSNFKAMTSDEIGIKERIRKKQEKCIVLLNTCNKEEDTERIKALNERISTYNELLLEE